MVDWVVSSMGVPRGAELLIIFVALAFLALFILIPLLIQYFIIKKAVLAALRERDAEQRAWQQAAAPYANQAHQQPARPQVGYPPTPPSDQR